MPLTEPLTTDIHLSHFRAEVKRDDSTGVVYARGAERRTENGAWVRMATGGAIKAESREALMEKAREWNEAAQRLLNARQMRRARRRRQRADAATRRRKARADYRDWLDAQPLTADAYKESKNRFRYTGGPDGGVEKRSIADWMDAEALKRWPDRTSKKKAEIREKYDLKTSVQLI